MYKIAFLLSTLLLFCNYDSNNGYSPLSEKHCQTTANNNIKINEVNDLGQRYGYSIWMNSDAIDANYHASKWNNQSVYQRYNTWKAGKSVFLTSSGGYSSNNYTTSLGLTIENGRVVNNLLDDNMDAIVVIYNGDLEVIDCRKKMKIKAINQTLQLSNRQDKTLFVNKMKQLKATVFQTHLLAKNDILKIKTDSDKKVAERKLLAIVEKDNESFYTLFYIKRGERLYNAAKKINNYLISKDYTVHNIINLDTGVHNILKTYQLKSCSNRVIEGESRIGSAVNLITFFKES
ncbi:MAG: hypothetical protein AB8G11_04495 [Saprospiraceae bacterium]